MQHSNVYQYVLLLTMVKMKLDHVLKNVQPTHYHFRFSIYVLDIAQLAILLIHKLHFVSKNVPNLTMEIHRRELVYLIVHSFKCYLQTIVQDNV
jgi:hypothetical protein